MAQGELEFPSQQAHDLVFVLEESPRKNIIISESQSTC